MDVTHLHLSWSALRTWEECRNKARLQRAGHRSKIQDIRGYFHGTVADRVMRDWLEDPELPPGGMERAVRATLEREEAAAVESGDGVVKWRHAHDRAQVTEFLVELARRLEPILREHVTAHDFEPARRFRVPFLIPRPGPANERGGAPVLVHLVGEVDLLVRLRLPDGSPGPFRVLDLKATADEGYWRKTFPQLVFYDLAHELGFGSPPDLVGLIQPMCKERVRTWTVTPEMRQALVTRVIAMAHSIWRGEETYAEALSTCTWCPVRHACNRFAPVPTQRDVSGRPGLFVDHGPQAVGDSL